MDAKPFLIFGGIGLGAVILFGSRQGRAAQTPLNRYSPVTAPPKPATVGEPHIHSGAERLTKNFVVGEWLKAPIQDYLLTQGQYDNLLKLTSKILQPYRDLIDPSTIEITGGGRPEDFRSSKPIMVTNWKTKDQVTVPSGSSIEDIIRAQGYSPVEDSDHHRFACADFVIMTKGTPDSLKMEKAFLDLQKYPETRQVGIYRVDGKVSHLHVAVVHPGHPKIIGERFAYQATEGE